MSIKKGLPVPANGKINGCQTTDLAAIDSELVGGAQKIRKLS